MDDLKVEFAERIAALEVHATQAKEDRDNMSTSLEKMHDDFKALNGTLSEMREELARYRGFWGGAILVCGAVWTFIQFAGEWFMSRLKGEG